MPASRSTTERLAFVKALWRQGKEQAATKSILAPASILSLQDSIELWLGIAAEKLSLDITRDQFPTALGRVCEAAVLGEQQALKNMNRARTNLKHHGIIPANFERFLEPVDAFLYEGTRAVFDLSFADLSLLQLIANSPARPFLDSATELLAGGDTKAAVDEIAKAFYTLSAKMALRTASLSGRPHVYGNPSRGDAWLRDAVAALDHNLIAVHSRLIMLELGIDVIRYLRFQEFMPMTVRSHSGKWQIRRNKGLQPRVEADPDETRDCLDFVIDVAIRLVERNTHAKAELSLVDQPVSSTQETD